MKLGFLISSLLFSNIVYGCFGEEDTLEDTQWKYKEEIFTGQVLKVERKVIELYPHSGDMFEVVGYEVTFKVETKWKGSTNNIVTITQSGSSCSEFFFIDDFAYFITAKERKFINNVEEDKANTSYLTTEGGNLTISQRKEDSLYQSAVRLMDSIFTSPIKLNDQVTEEISDSIMDKSGFISLLYGVLIGFFAMFLLMRKRINTG